MGLIEYFGITCSPDLLLGKTFFKLQLANLAMLSSENCDVPEMLCQP